MHPPEPTALPFTPAELKELEDSLRRELNRPSVGELMSRAARAEAERTALEAHLTGTGKVELSERQQADELLAAYELLSPDDQRKALLQLAGIPDSEAGQAVLVKTPNGKLAMQKVDPQLAAAVEAMGKQGFQTATFTNRHSKRAAKAKARRARK